MAWIALLVAIWFSHPASLGAQDMEVPVALQIPLFLKVMSFDRAAGGRVGRSLVIAVVYQSRNRASASAKDEAMHALYALPQSAERVKRRGVAIDLDSEPLATALKRERADVIYVTPLRGEDIPEIAAAAAEIGATTWTGVPRYVSQGLAVGVRRERDRPRIMINMKAARLQGCDFSAELLKLALLI